MNIYSNLQKQEKANAFLTQLAAAVLLPSDAWLTKENATCTALVIHLTGADVLNRKDKQTVA